jgi:virginiamycin B lyase
MWRALLSALAVLCVPLLAAAVEPMELPADARGAMPASDLVFLDGALWALGEGKVLRLDPNDGSVAELALPESPNTALLGLLERYRGLAAGEGFLWVPDLASSTIVKIDPAKRAVVGSVPTDIFGSRGSVGIGEASVWVVTFDARDKRLTRYSAETGVLQAQIDLPGPGLAVLVAYGEVWVTATNRPELYRIDPRANAVAAVIPLLAPSPLLEAAEGSLWVSSDATGIVQRIDPSTGQVLATIETGALDMESDGDLASGGGFLWTINRAAVIARIDPANNTVLGLYRPPSGPSSSGRRIAFGAGSLWLSGSGLFQVKAP